jgi:hypothetical protein
VAGRLDHLQFGDAMFCKATFASNAAFDGARFNSGASFERVEFTKAPRLGPLSAGGQVILDRATFGAHALVEVAAARLSCVETQFPEGADLRLRDAEVALDGAVFAKSSTIAADDLTSSDTNAPGQTTNPGAKMVVDEAPRPAGGHAKPRLLSLRRVDVSTLTLANVNLEPCLFAGAHNLDKLRIEGPLSFARTPPEAWRVRLGRWQVPIWKWTNRQALAEEHHWRAKPPTTPAADRFAKRLDQPRWSRPGEKSSLWLKRRSGHAVQPLDPHQLTALYRTMRKGREDNKDEPGAADFYYGEMEMRRKAAATPAGERLILTVYWLVSGYGLRGLRALAWLAIVTVGLAVLLQSIGFNRGDPSFRDALIYATQSTLSLASSTKALTDRVSWAGEALRIVLRLTGPILLALAVLSVRNRIKR